MAATTSPLAKGWDVDALTSTYAFSPTATRDSEDGEGGGLSPEPEDGSGASWQNEFAALEASLLSGIRAPPKAVIPQARPAHPAAARASAPAADRPLHERSLASGNHSVPPLAAAGRPVLPRCPTGAESSSGRRYQSTGTVASAGPSAAAANVASSSYRGHGAAGSTSSAVGQTTADMGNGINMDKRRCRQLNRDDFMAAIAQYRASLEERNGGSDAAGTAATITAAAAPPSVRRGASGGLGSVRGWVRKRPLLPHEEVKGEYDAVSVEGRRSAGGVRGESITTHCCLLKPDLRRMFIRHSTFGPNGGVLDEAASSDDCFAAFGLELVELALRGGRGTLLMYGQTGSGKTMTISDLQVRAAHHLFGGAAGGAAGGGGHPPRAAAVEVTAIEVAGRACRDLHSGSACTVLQTKAGGAQLKGAVPFVATSAASLAAHLERVLKSRRTEATAVNATSSRSHALITLRVGVDGAPEGRLTLLDCAGSEWSNDSSEHGSKRRKEGAEINASLHALKQCVRAQAEKARAGGKGHVPYRDAVLTRLLRDSFEADGFDCRLAMVGCVSPGAADSEHTTSTLRCVMELSSAKASAEECTTAIQQVPRLRSLAAAAERQAAAAAAAAAANAWASAEASHLVLPPPPPHAAAVGAADVDGAAQAAAARPAVELQ